MKSMLDGLSDYQLDEEIYSSLKSVIYRGHQKDRLPVILKGLQHDYPQSEEIDRIVHEYEVLTHLAESGDPIFQKPQPCIPIVCGLEGRTNHPILVMEDQNSITLQTFLAQQTNVSRQNLPFLKIELFLKIAIQLVDILSHLHQQQVIHKDINPTNILIHLEKVSLIDFGIASLLPREIQSLTPPEQLEGTLAYIAPEQTGRMNRNLDYRVDYYSLGVTFYQMLVGEVPFKSNDAMELVHAHIAKPPPIPHEVNFGIPVVLSNIICKLMAKSADDRYQSGSGLRFDLEKCLSEWKSQVEGRSRNLAEFELGSKDRSSRFQIKEQLYGRDQEVETLLNAFQRVCQGGREMFFISGFAGTGKSALVHEVYKSMTEKRGHFISGKYNQYQRDNPFSAICEALKAFCHYLLGLDKESLVLWEEKILAAIGQNGQVLTKLIPDLELVIGKQSDVSETGPMEAKNRLNLVFGNFIQTLCQNHPLILFLDDLQWADTESLDLLKLIVLNEKIQHLLIIGAYRNDEVNEEHPLCYKLKEIEQAHDGLNTKYEESLGHTPHLLQASSLGTVQLENLAVEEINQLVSDTLHMDSIRTHPLAELICHKTGGNAFFSIEFFKSLYTEGLLVLDRSSQDQVVQEWRWDLEQIRNKNITNNVIELMTEKILKLQPMTQTLLQLAACIGNHFDLNTLSILNTDESRKLLLQNIQPAIEEGLIVPLESQGTTFRGAAFRGAAFRFIHDRIQQAAYSMRSSKKREQTHWQIGHLWLANTLEEPSPERPADDVLFEIVKHFNHAHTLIRSKEDRFLVAELNLKAGKKAKQSSAFKAAFNYLKTGAELLSDALWATHHQFMFDLHVELAEVSYLSTHFEEANKLYSILLEKAQSDQEQYAVYSIQLKQLMVEGKFAESIEVAKKALKILGISVPDTLLEASQIIEKEVATFPTYLAGRKIAELPQEIKKSGTKEERQLILLSSLSTSALVTSQDQLSNWSNLKGALLCLKNGHNEIASFSYIIYAYTVLACLLKDYKNAYEYGKMAMALSEQYSNLAYKGRTYFVFAAFINPLKKPLSESFFSLRNAIQFCMEGGDFVYAAYAIGMLSNYQIISGQELPKIRQELEKHIPFIKRTNQVHFEGRIRPAILQVLKNLVGTTLPGMLSDPEDQPDAFNESDFLQKTHTTFTFALFYCAKIRSLTFFGQYEEALQYLDKVEIVAQALPGTVIISETYFYMSLALNAVLAKGSPELSGQSDHTEGRPTQYQQILETYQTDMKSWAEHAPANFEHKYLLVEAGRASQAGQLKKAMGFYKQGIASAKKYGFLNMEAFGNELYALFWLEQEEMDYVKVHIIHAYKLYQQWGAVAKVKALEEKFPNFLLATHAYEKAANTTLVKGKVINLDAMTVMKASQAISGEIMLGSLLTKFIAIVMENAGADKGILVMPDRTSGKLLIQASQIENQIEVLQSKDVETSKLLSLAMVRFVSRSSESIVLGDATKDGDYTRNPYVLREQPKSILCLPILKQGLLIGILYLENRVANDAFTKDRLELLHILASQAAISIENAELVENLEQQVQERTRKLTAEIEIRKLAEKSLHESVYTIKKQQNQIEEELEKARKIQKSLLPSQPSIIPNAKVICRFHPMTQIGGDFYNVFHLKDEWYGILLADVSGHGIPAALLSFMFSITFTMNAINASSPGQALESTNAHLYGELPRGHFATMFYGLYHATNRTLVYSSGGHPPALLIRSSPLMTKENAFRDNTDHSYDDQIIKLDTKGGMVGCFPVGVMDYPDSSIELQPGDKLLIYTDGVTEVKNDEGKMLKLPGLISMIKSLIHLPIEELIDEIYEQVDHYNSIAEPHDDITIMGIGIE